MTRTEGWMAIGMFFMASFAIAGCTYLVGPIMGGFLFCGLFVSFVFLLENME